MSNKDSEKELYHACVLLSQAVAKIQLNKFDSLKVLKDRMASFLAGKQKFVKEANNDVVLTGKQIKEVCSFAGYDVSTPEGMEEDTDEGEYVIASNIKVYDEDMKSYYEGEAVTCLDCVEEGSMPLNDNLIKVTDNQPQLDERVMNYKINANAKVKVRAKTEIKLSTDTGMSITHTYPKNASVAGIIKEMMLHEFHNSGRDGLKGILNDVLELTND